MTRELVLLPGVNNTAAVFDRLSAALQPVGALRLHAMDNPALDSVDAIAAALLEQLPARFWLAGFSFGGYVALAVLAAAPERVQGIALICSTPGADDAQAVARRQVALQAVEQGRYLELVRAQAPNAFHPDSLADAQLMAERWAMVLDYGPGAYAAHVQACMARPDRRSLLDGRVPTLVVGASHDRVVPPEALGFVSVVPGARQVIVEGAGHLLPMERPAELAGHLQAWMGLA